MTDPTDDDRSWQDRATEAGWMSPDAHEGEIPWEFFAKHAGWRQVSHPEPATDTRGALRSAIINVTSNARNYPEAVQARMLGQDTTQLLEAIIDAVLERFTPVPEEGS